MKSELCRAAHIGAKVTMCLSAAAFLPPAVAAAVTYEASAFTNVRLGERVYRNADLRLKFVGNTNDIELARDNTGAVVGNDFYWLAKGRASFSITSYGRTISGTFPDGEIFIGFDAGNGGVGFGTHSATVFEPVYPLAFDSIPEPYTDIATTVTLTGHAWSCVNFLSGACAPPLPIKTTRLGDLIVEQPYTQLAPSGGYTGPDSGSMNRGTFSISVSP